MNRSTLKYLSFLPMLITGCQIAAIERPTQAGFVYRVPDCASCRLANDAIISRAEKYDDTILFAAEGTSGFESTDRWTSLLGDTLYTSFVDAVDRMLDSSPVQFVRLNNNSLRKNTQISVCNQGAVGNALNSGKRVLFAEGSLDYYNESAETDIVDFDLFAKFTHNGDPFDASGKTGNTLSRDEARVTARIYDCETQRLAMEPVSNKVYVYSGASDNSFYVMPMEGGAFLTNMNHFSESRRDAVDFALSRAASRIIMSLAYLPSEIDDYLNVRTDLDIDIVVSSLDGRVCIGTRSAMPIDEEFRLLVRSIDSMSDIHSGDIKLTDLSERHCFVSRGDKQTVIAQLVDSDGVLRGQTTSIVDAVDTGEKR